VDNYQLRWLHNDKKIDDHLFKQLSNVCEFGGSSFDDDLKSDGKIVKNTVVLKN
jgi:hypothetical protein